MALPASGAISFLQMEAEYQRTPLENNFDMSQCYALNSGLGVASATAQISASDFYNARYGIDERQITKGSADFGGGLTWYGYQYAGFGSVNTRSIMEQSNQLSILASLSNGTTYFKAVNATYGRIHAFFIDGNDIWGSRIYDAGGDQYYWNTQYWTNTSGIGSNWIWYNQ